MSRAGLSGSSRGIVVPGIFPFFPFSRQCERTARNVKCCQLSAVIRNFFQLRQAFQRIFVEHRLRKNDAWQTHSYVYTRISPYICDSTSSNGVDKTTTGDAGH